MKTLRIGPQKFAAWVLGAALVGLCPAVAQQSSSGQTQPPQQPASVAEAARKAKQEKKPAAKPNRVFGDEKPVTPAPPAAAKTEEGEAGAGEYGAAAAPPTEEAPAAPAAAAGEAPSSAEQDKARGESKSALAAEKERLAKLKEELSLLQRERDLKRQQFYGGMEYLNKPGGKAELDAMEAQITAKKEEITAVEQRITELEDNSKTLDLRQGPEKEKPLSSDEQRTQWANRMRLLRDELAKIDEETNRFRTESTARGANPKEITTGSPTANQLELLQKRRADVERRIAELEDEARRAGVPADWLR